MTTPHWKYLVEALPLDAPRPRPYPWLVVRDERTMACERCGTVETLEEPLRFGAMIRQTNRFERKHKKCREPIA